MRDDSLAASRLPRPMPPNGFLLLSLGVDPCGEYGIGSTPCSPFSSNVAAALYRLRFLRHTRNAIIIASAITIPPMTIPTIAVGYSVDEDDAEDDSEEVGVLDVGSFVETAVAPAAREGPNTI